MHDYFKLGVGALVGIVFTVASCCIGCVVVACVCRRRRRKYRADRSQTAAPAETDTPLAPDASRSPAVPQPQPQPSPQPVVQPYTGQSHNQRGARKRNCISNKLGWCPEKCHFTTFYRHSGVFLPALSSISCLSGQCCFASDTHLGWICAAPVDDGNDGSTTVELKVKTGGKSRSSTSLSAPCSCRDS